jgi:hypothetical protein
MVKGRCRLISNRAYSKKTEHYNSKLEVLLILQIVSKYISDIISLVSEISQACLSGCSVDTHQSIFFY